jgi:hypothetical protein
MTRRRLLIVVGLLVIGGLAASSALRLATAAKELRDVEDLVDEAAEALEDGRLQDATRALDTAQDRVLRANDALRRSFGLDVVGLFPVVSQNLRSLEDSVALATLVVHGGGQILRASEPLQSEDGTLEVSLSDGTIPLDAVSDAQEQISRLTAQMAPALRAEPPSLLLPQVREMSDAVRTEARMRNQQLQVLGRGLELLRQLAGGDGARRFLIAVANSAEMRGSGGMILNYGVLEGRDGVIDLVDFGDIDELSVAASVSPELVPADYLARWSGFDALSRFRQANLAGDFTIVAPVLEALYTSATRLPVNGVIQVDPDGLAAILEGVGPVVVPELGEVRADNVVDLTLNEAYIRFPDVETRTDVLGDVAEAAFQRLVDGEYTSLRPLAEAVAHAVDGRHILMRAGTSSAEGAVAAFAADGAYPPLEGAGDAFAMTAQNLAGNKLDYYLDTDLALTGRREAGALGALDATITLTNGAPAGVTEPRYIFGPGPGDAALAAGTLRSLVTLYLPLGTEVTEVAGDATVEPVATGTEGGRPFASFMVDVPASEARAVQLSLRLAPRSSDPYELHVVPSPRVRPTTVRVDVTTEAGVVRGSVELDRQWVLAPGVEPAPVLAPVFR